MRGLKLAFVLAVISLAGAPSPLARAADAPAAGGAGGAENLCLTNKCRPAETWVVFNDTDGKKKKANAGNLAYTNTPKGAMTAVLGETLKFNGETDGKIVANVALAEAQAATDTDPAALAGATDKGAGQIVIKFAQTKDPKTNSRLLVTHNFKGNLAFDAYLLTSGSTEYKMSPACPVAEGTSVSTTWYVPVLAVTLANFHFVKKIEPNTASEIICQ